MRVLLVGNYLPDGQYSMQGFFGALQAGLVAPNLRVVPIRPEVRVGSLGLGKLRKWTGYADKYVFFPRRLRREAKSVDLVHICDHGNAMYVPHVKSQPHLITCHDLLAVRAARGEFPDWTVGPSGQQFQSLILSGLREAAYVACVSEATRHDLCRLTAHNEKSSETVYNGFYRPVVTLAEDQVDQQISQLGLAGVSFVLHVGGNQPYKNRVGAARIFGHLLRMPGLDGLHAVIAGKPPTEALSREIATLPSDRTHVFTALSDEAIESLYRRAQALVFPSLHEGFGLPVIEAQACGCPVFTSNRAPMNEIGGAAAVTFDPEEPERAAQVIAANWERRHQMIDAGRQNIARFSTSQMVDRYAALYRRLCP